MKVELHPKQSIAFMSKATEILYGGAAGGGKSHLMRIKAITLCLKIPKLQVYLFRRHFDELIKNHFDGPTGFPALLDEYVKAGFAQITYGPPTVKFSNGACIHLCHCQYEKDVTKYQGAEIHVLIIDELTHFTDKIYRYLRARCRVTGLSVPPGIKLPLILCGSNPGGIGHNWVKAAWPDRLRHFEILQMPKEEGGMLRQYIPAKLQDNPSLNAEDYEAQLAGLGAPYLVKAMLEGSWDIVAGGMFDDLWNPEVHAIPPFEIPREWRVDRSFDWGSSKPYSVGWWAESDGSDILLPGGRRLCTLPGDLFRIAELYGWNGNPNEGAKETAKEIARKILDIEKSLPYKIEPGPADSAIWTNENSNCIADDMAAVGVEWEMANKSPGSRKNGWELMRQILKGSINRDGKGLFIFSTCRQFIRTVPVLPRDMDGGKPDDVDSKAEDHVADETRYRILNEAGTGSVSFVPGLGG